MPVLQGALLCDSAHDYGGLVSILGGFASILRISNFPAISGVWFAGRVGIEHDEARRPHEVVVRAVTDGGDELGRVTARMPPQDPSSLPEPELMGGLNLVFPLPFHITGPGMHWVELTVDGQPPLARLPLKVIDAAARP